MVSGPLSVHGILRQKNRTDGQEALRNSLLSDSSRLGFNPEYLRPLGADTTTALQSIQTSKVMIDMHGKDEY